MLGCEVGNISHDVHLKIPLSADHKPPEKISIKQTQVGSGKRGAFSVGDKPPLPVSPPPPQKKKDGVAAKRGYAVARTHVCTLYCVLLESVWWMYQEGEMSSPLPNSFFCRIELNIDTEKSSISAFLAIIELWYNSLCGQYLRQRTTERKTRMTCSPAA